MKCLVLSLNNRFDHLQLSLNKKEPISSADHQNEESAGEGALCKFDQFRDSAADAAMSDWSAMLMNLTNTTGGSVTSPPNAAMQTPGVEVSTATTDLLSLLDATTDRLLQEATKQWCTLGYTPLDIPSPAPSRFCAHFAHSLRKSFLPD